MKVKRGIYPSTTAVSSMNLLCSVNTQILLLFGGFFFKEKSTSLCPFFPFCSAQAANFWSCRGFEWKAINKEMGSFLIVSRLRVYFVMTSSSAGKWRRSYSIAICLRQAVTCLWVWVSSSLWYVLCQALIRDWWKCVSGPLQSWWQVKWVAGLISLVSISSSSLYHLYYMDVQ